MFTIEPGLYFPPDNMSVPAEFRGLAVRIEDNIALVRHHEEGGLGGGGSGGASSVVVAENLTQSIPKSIAEVEHAVAGRQRGA